MPLSAPAAHRLRAAGLAIAAVLLALSLAAMLLLGFGWALLRPLAERRASAALGRPVRIEAIRRTGGGLFDPVLAVTGLRVAQPAWAGPGVMLAVRELDLRLPVLPLLAGRARPRFLRLEGVRARLLRRVDGQANWDPEGPRDSRPGRSPDLRGLVVEDAQVALDDREHRHRYRLAIRSDAAGFRLAGPGDVAGSPATLSLAGPPLDRPGPWPFRAALRSRAVTLRAAGRMRAPLDIRHLSADVTGRGEGLQELGHAILTGLPETQPFRLTAFVVHDQPSWVIHRLSGTLGRSAVAGELEIRRQPDDRGFLKGSLRSTGLDLDDLASDRQLAQGRAEHRRTGDRLFPDVSIDLSKLRNLDGVLHLDVARLLHKGPSVFRTARGTLTLDHGVLTAAPLRVGLAAGEARGSLVVRHQAGAPLLLVDLRLTGGRFEALANTGGVVRGPVAARLKLAGHGGTARAAIGRAGGRIGVAGHGTIERRVALFLGADVGRGLFAGNRARADLRCLVADMAVARGVARPAPLVVDMDVARADGRGRVSLASERVALQLFGQPKKNSLLRLNGPIEAGGTLEHPTFNPPPQTKTVGGILKMFVHALGGPKRPVATDADCAGLTRRALR